MEFNSADGTMLKHKTLVANKINQYYLSINNLIMLDVSGTKKEPETVEDKGSGDVNMEASNDDDVMRAGGFGARDDISSFLPVASDSTDFEASLRDARQYEEPQKDVCRPGLGWNKEDVKKKKKEQD
ncbi:hypothetical protein HanHA300_Chr10g0358201 [Helianthus annuus]|nr:hypothetical protein HanHA300_Chr10g0358201 [Helianthus annuus]KAJ0529601.1 hypothetical protein HanHA89_Chr10g0379741 [Helianthus annuus]KAJ0696487.1 hypothetical protein HanLR1_Chr10g0357661 [Helianthus annuus]